MVYVIYSYLFVFLPSYGVLRRILYPATSGIFITPEIILSVSRRGKHDSILDAQHVTPRGIANS